MPTAQAATEAEINTAIDNGITWLVAQQHSAGDWGSSYRVAETGLAVLKLEDRAYELGFTDPLDPSYEYSDEIQKGLDYLFTRVEVGGDHDGAIWYSSSHRCYETSVAIMAISRSGHPEKIVTVGPRTDWTYKQVVEGAVNYLDLAQHKSGTYEGGWRYYRGYSDADNSVSGWTTLGLIYAQNEFGVAIPTQMLTHLDNWINYIQNDASGGSGYTTPGNYVNILKTGNLLFQMKMVGDDQTSERAQNAIKYIQNNWNNNYVSYQYGPGWKPRHIQSMYTTMKGLEAMGIDTLAVGGNPVDWYDEFATALVRTQEAEGWWATEKDGPTTILTTCWALLVLEKSVEIPATFAVEKSADSYNVPVGASVTYTYEVKNTGIVSISGITLTDDQLGVIAGPVSGDDGDGVLEPLETWTYTATTTLTVTTTNTATATGLDPDSDTVTTTSNPVTVTVGDVAIPEFPTIALPVVSILGLLFFFNHRKRRREEN